MTSCKVAHIITRLDWGGSARDVMLTVLGQDRRRFEPVVITGLASDDEAQGGSAATQANCQQLERAGIRCRVLPSLRRSIHPLSDVLTLLGLIRLLRIEKPTIVHTHTSKAGLLGRLAAWLAGIPVVIHRPHGHVFYGHFGRLTSWLFLKLERLWARWTTTLIALTPAERDEHLSRGVGRPRSFQVIPSGIELDRFSIVSDPSRPRPQPIDWPCPSQARVIGSVGWLTPVKGHAFLIEAMAAVRARHPDVQLVIIGSGPLREDLSRLAARLGIRAGVHLLDVRTDIPECLAAMDLFVLPSLNEGMGRALIEAMAAGRPVIATRVGGIPGVIQDRQNGRLVPPGDAAALAAAITELLAAPTLAAALGNAARKSIDERYAVRAMVAAIEEVYDQALAGAGRQPRSVPACP